MVKYKMQVENLVERKTAISLFLDLGYHVCEGGTDDSYLCLLTHENGVVRSTENLLGCSSFLPIEIDHLRDLAVLKRNDINDKNHHDNYGKEIFLTSDNVIYYWDGNKWSKSAFNGTKDSENYIKNCLTSVNKTNTREFLDPERGYLYIALAEHEIKEKMLGHEKWIEIPEGAELYAYWPINQDYNFQAEKSYFENGSWQTCAWTLDQIKSGEAGAKALWQRNQDLISGDVALANVHKLIVQYKHDDEPYDRWTTITNNLWSQYHLGMFLDLDTKFKFRFKPQMFNLNGMDVPAPLAEHPLVKTPYFYLRPDWEKGYCQTTWEDIPIDKKRFSNGIWPTESAIRQVVAAFRKTIQVL